LLKEQRTGIINKAVTKGINPGAKMKPSGIEWIGEIPDGWEVWKLKFLTGKIGSGVTPLGGSQVYKTEGVAFFRSQNIYNDKFELSGISFIDEETHQSMKNSQIEDGDVLLNITGASIGRCFFYSGEFQEANVNQHVCIIRPNLRVLVHFLHSVLISEIGQNQIFSKQSGSNREGLNFEQLRNFSIPLPPPNEQRDIIDIIKSETLKIDTLISKYQKQIDLMQEYRTSLISQAVTGKIDVRDWQKNEPQE
jgi:type I restriction enzyme S subunit